MADRFDPYIMEDWNSAIQTAEIYATEILKLANYQQAVAARLASVLIHEFSDHDYDINFDLAQTLGIRVEKNDATDRNKKVWRYFRAWLGKYLFEESATHQIRYVFPTLGQETANEQSSSAK